MNLGSLLAGWVDDRAIDCAPTTAGWYRSMAGYLAPSGWREPVIVQPDPPVAPVAAQGPAAPVLNGRGGDE